MNRYSDMTINQLRAELRLIEDELICRGYPINKPPQAGQGLDERIAAIRKEIFSTEDVKEDSA